MVAVGFFWGAGSVIPADSWGAVGSLGPQASSAIVVSTYSVRVKPW